MKSKTVKSLAAVGGPIEDLLPLPEFSVLPSANVVLFDAYNPSNFDELRKKANAGQILLQIASLNRQLASRPVDNADLVARRYILSTYLRESQPTAFEDFLTKQPSAEVFDKTDVRRPSARADHNSLCLQYLRVQLDKTCILYVIEHGNVFFVGKIAVSNEKLQQACHTCTQV